MGLPSWLEHVPARLGSPGWNWKFGPFGSPPLARQKGGAAAAEAGNTMSPTISNRAVGRNPAWKSRRTDKGEGLS